MAHQHHHHGSHHEHGAEPAATGSADLSAPGSPLFVEVTRGSMVESRHRGRAAIVDAAGHVMEAWGDIEAPVYARSAVKSLQAIPLVETGAFDAFGLGERELALACSSHNGEPVHTELAAQWIGRIGCTVHDYECGCHLPYDAETAHAMIRRGEEPTALHNNCSGKHAGMLTTARHKGEPLKGYVRYDHPVQQRILGVLEQMTGRDLSRAAWGIDGCSIPTIAIPLGAIAFAMARIANPAELPDRRAEAVTRIRTAWGRHPYLVHGKGGFDSGVMEAIHGRVLLKGGAEGVYCAVLPEMGLGIALKIDDGAARAATIAMGALLTHVGAVSAETMAAFATTPVENRRGLHVGDIRPAAPWPNA